MNAKIPKISGNILNLGPNASTKGKIRAPKQISPSELTNYGEGKPCLEGGNKFTNPLSGAIIYLTTAPDRG